LLENYSDRFLVVAFLGEEALGTYTVGESIAMYIANIVIFSLSYAWCQFLFRFMEKREKKNRDLYAKCLKYLLIAILPMWFGYVAVSKELIIVLAQRSTLWQQHFSTDSSRIVCWDSECVFGASFYLKKKTMLMFLIEFSSIPINIGMNLILIKRLEFIGASISGLVSIIVSTTLMIVVSRRYFRIGIELGSLLYYIGVSCIMFLCRHPN